MTYTSRYLGAYLAVLFPRLTSLYEKLSGKKIPYRNSALIPLKDPERADLLTGARFKPGVLKMLEQRLGAS